MSEVTNTTVNAANNAATEKKQSKAKINPENLTFPIFVGSGENVEKHYIHPDLAKNPLTFIGGAVKQFEKQFSFFADFPINKQLVKVPAIGQMGEKERALRGHVNYLSAITKGMEQTDEITDKKSVAVLQVYTSKGWKFKTMTKKGILTVAGEKLREVTTSVRLIKAITLDCPELKNLVANNKNRVLVAKEIEDKGIQAGLKLAKELSFKQLPAITK